MLEGNDPERQAAERDAQLRKLAQKDRRISLRHGYDFGTAVAPDTGEPIMQIHNREGGYIGFRGPNGEMFILTSKAVVYLYGPRGRLRERFVADDLPKGYTALTSAELQREFFRRTNEPQVGNLIN